MRESGPLTGGGWCIHGVPYGPTWSCAHCVGSATGGNLAEPLTAVIGHDYTDLLLLIAECLVPLAFAVEPDGGARQSRLYQIAKAYREDTDAS